MIKKLLLKNPNADFTSKAHLIRVLKETKIYIYVKMWKLEFSAMCKKESHNQIPGLIFLKVS